MCSSSLPITTRARTPSASTSRNTAVTPVTGSSAETPSTVSASLSRTVAPTDSSPGSTPGARVRSMRRPEVMTSTVSPSAGTASTTP